MFFLSCLERGFNRFTSLDVSSEILGMESNQLFSGKSCSSWLHNWCQALRVGSTSEAFAVSPLRWTMRSLCSSRMQPRMTRASPFSARTLPLSSQRMPVMSVLASSCHSFSSRWPRSVCSVRLRLTHSQSECGTLPPNGPTSATLFWETFLPAAFLALHLSWVAANTAHTTYDVAKIRQVGRTLAPPRSV